MSFRTGKAHSLASKVMFDGKTRVGSTLTFVREDDCLVFYHNYFLSSEPMLSYDLKKYVIKSFDKRFIPYNRLWTVLSIVSLFSGKHYYQHNTDKPFIQCSEKKIVFSTGKQYKFNNASRLKRYCNGERIMVRHLDRMNPIYTCFEENIPTNGRRTSLDSFMVLERYGKKCLATPEGKIISDKETKDEIDELELFEVLI